LQAEIEAFRREKIVQSIIEAEIRDNSMMAWLATLVNHDFDGTRQTSNGDKEEEEPDAEDEDDDKSDEKPNNDRSRHSFAVDARSKLSERLI
jgi:hypothetical protein